MSKKRTSIFSLPFLPFRIANDFLASQYQSLLPKIWRVPAHLGTVLSVPYGLAWINDVSLYPFDIGVIFGGLVCTTSAYFKYYRFDNLGGEFGKQRFAYTYEPARKGLSGSGVVLGRIDGFLSTPLGSYLVTKPEGKPGHVLINGPTGKGKSKGYAIPTILNWKGSIICIDPKLELYGTTAHLRQGKVFVFNPMDPNCAQYDPIENIRDANDAQDLAKSLLPSQGSGDKFWNRAAVSIVAAAFLEAKNRRMTLHEACSLFTDFSAEVLVKKLSESPYTGVKELVSVARDGADDTLKGIFMEIRSHLGMIAGYEHLKQATKYGDWSPADLEKGATIYLGIPESKLQLNQYRGILNAIINQTISHLCEREEGKEPAILIMIDEMPRLGYIPQFVDALATLRSRNVTIMPVIQSIAQLDKNYTKDGRRIILDNCTYKVVLGSMETETQKYFSDLAGFKTIETESTSTSHNPQSSGSTSHSKTGVPLVRSEEFGNESFQPLIFTPLTFPIQTKTAWFNTDPTIRLLWKPAPDPAIEGTKEKEKKDALEKSGA